MRIVHVGPPLARLGGPPGYLFELSRAARGREVPGLDVVFPPEAARGRAGPRPPFWRRSLSRMRRALWGPPQFYRPPESTLRSERGEIHRLLEETAHSVREEAGPMLSRALEAQTDVVFLHEPITAEQVLDNRKPHQRVWMMVHAPMPLALYVAWSFGVPERDWRDVLHFPDVLTWVGRELDVWRRVDRLVLPSPEAAEELERIDPRFHGAPKKVQYLLTGGAAPAPTGETWTLPDAPVGLFLGNAQPYRGLDRLLEALSLIPRSSPGIVAVAGPAPDSLPRHPRLLPLGRVSDVPGLLRAVDFVINVNRFSLFDLSTIEATEAGKPLLLHAVGGNKTFQVLGAGVHMLKDLAPSTIASGLEEMFSRSASDRASLGARSRGCYEAHLTPERFWRRHVDLYQERAAEVARV